MNITIIGKTGTGKSFLTHRLLSRIRDDIPIYMFTDNPQDFSGMGDRVVLDYTNYRKLNYDTVFSKKRVVFEMGMISNTEINEFFDIFALKLYLHKRPAIVAIDEAHMFFGKTKHSKNLERLVRGGRKYFIHVIMITQQIVDLDTTIIKQSKYVFSFRLTELNDVFRTSVNLQINPDILRTLLPYHYIMYDMYRGIAFEGVEEIA